MDLNTYDLNAMVTRDGLAGAASPRIRGGVRQLTAAVQDELLAQVEVLKQFGPETGRPRVDTMNGSKYANMKELRFSAGNGVWRVAFAFDPGRRAVLLVAGDKSGVSQQRFYKRLIATADERFERYLDRLAK
jgi:hypothetical protein